MLTLSQREITTASCSSGKHGGYIMDKIIKVSEKKNHYYWLFLLLAFAIYGCSAVGRVIPQDQRLALSTENSEQTTFTAKGLVVDYSYSMEGQTMTIRGNGRPKISRLDSFHLHLLFLDSTGTVLEQKLLYSRNYRETRGSSGNRGF
jgi:hypothetical protein